MFSLTPNKNVSRDASNRITHIEHIEEPFVSASFEEPTPELLADEYVAAVTQTYQMEAAPLTDLESGISEQPTDAEAKIHRESKKDIAGSIVVDYKQSYQGLPVWGADFAVHIASNPMRVTSSNSTLHDSITLDNDSKKVASEYQKKLTKKNIAKSLGLKEEKGISKINGMRLMIYQYDADQRIEPDSHEEGETAESFEQEPLTLPLPSVPKAIKPEMHYAVVEVLFDLAGRKWKGLHWRALIEPMSGAALYVRALVSSATGSVFRLDPISQTGDATLIPSAAEALLNPLRTSVPLSNLTISSPQDLSGTQVDIAELKPPVIAEPTTTTPFNFTYGAKTENFAAVNSYYHVNWFFNLMKGMGFNLATYFDNTTFPVPVDHWSMWQQVNAHCPGNATGNGIGHLCFGVAQAGELVGIGDDVRVVIHEFGHGLLWDHVNSPNFGFAHSAGDALGAILMDPISHAPDRYLTFPWPQGSAGPLDRRHDRKVADGWAWFGNMYNTGYRGEQVLSTTLFRLYQSVGGNSPHAGDRAWASRYVSYLIIKAIGTLTSTTSDPTVFVTALKNADLTTVNFEGHPGGALHKVIRWAFEKQGLFQPAGTPEPYTTEGKPPAVDVYIDDGRNGEYNYLYAFWESKDMWVRRLPDGGMTHQNPIVGRPNYMYVRVKNRGTTTAQKVTVRAFDCDPGTGLAWPDHWTPMDTPILAAPGPIPPGGEVVVGPFKWTPEKFGHECLLAIASATGDPANDTTVAGPIPHSRFVPFDNNIGQRNVHPVLVLNWKDILKYFRKLIIKVINPYEKPVKVEIKPILPKFLRAQGCRVVFRNPGQQRFKLGPYATKEVMFSVVQKPIFEPRRPILPVPIHRIEGIVEPEDMIEGDGDLDFEEFITRGRPLKFRVVTLMNNQNMGGITYIIYPRLGRLPWDEPVGTTTREMGPEVEQIRETLCQQPGVKGVRIRGVTLDVELEQEA